MFCVYCGAEMHDKANFCPKCGKPVKASVTIIEEAVAEETSVEEVVTEETSVEEVVAEETSVEEVVAEETSVEEAVAEETSVEEVVAEETAVEEITLAEKDSKKPANSKSLAKKNVKVIAVYLISAAIVAGLGFFGVPKYIFHSAFETTAENSTSEKALTFYRILGNSQAVSDTKFQLAKNALENDDYAYAAAVFSELAHDGYETEENLVSYIDEAFGGRCRILVNGGKYDLAAADSTQISDPLLRTSIINDTLVSKAKILSADGKSAEAYEMVAGVNTSAAYDSESYNIIVYNYAVGFYNEMKFAETIDILENATDDASVELLRSSAYYMANDFLKEKNYERAIEMYEKAEDYSDSAERLRQCNYQLGLRYYNLNKPDTALEYFTASDGYKEAASYIKKIEEKKAYMGWAVDGFTTDYVNTLTGRPNPEKERIAASDPFIYYFTLTNENNNTNGISINVKITTPDGNTADETFENVKNGDVNCYISGYEFSQYGALGRAYFTVTIVETGEILDTCYFEIY